MATGPGSLTELDAGIYVERSEPPTFEDCSFYHVTELPDHRVTDGEWDLRGHVDDYLGHTLLAGRRVLEIGTASGFVCFEMERRGAEVVALDLSPELPHDIVPYDGLDDPEFEQEMARHVERTNNAWWYCHRAFDSGARLVHASVYDVPEGIGSVDVCTFGSVLLHLRDPFAAMASALRLTRGTAIVTEFLGPVLPARAWPAHLRARNPFALAQLASRLGVACSFFLPDPRTRDPRVAWWVMTPAVIQRFLGTLGFDTRRVIRHRANYLGLPHHLYTVVAERARG